MTRKTPRHHQAEPLTLDQLTQLWLCDEPLTPREQNRLWRPRTSGSVVPKHAATARDVPEPINDPPGRRLKPDLRRCVRPTSVELRGLEPLTPCMPIQQSRCRLRPARSCSRRSSVELRGLEPLTPSMPWPG